MAGVTRVAGVMEMAGVTRVAGVVEKDTVVGPEGMEVVAMAGEMQAEEVGKVVAVVEMAGVTRVAGVTVHRVNFSLGSLIDDSDIAKLGNYVRLATFDKGVEMESHVEAPSAGKVERDRFKGGVTECYVEAPSAGEVEHRRDGAGEIEHDEDKAGEAECHAEVPRPGRWSMVATNLGVTECHVQASSAGEAGHDSDKAEGTECHVEMVSAANKSSKAMSMLVRSLHGLSIQEMLQMKSPQPVHEPDKLARLLDWCHCWCQHWRYLTKKEVEVLHQSMTYFVLSYCQPVMRSGERANYVAFILSGAVDIELLRMFTSSAVKRLQRTIRLIHFEKGRLNPKPFPELYERFTTAFTKFFYQYFEPSGISTAVKMKLLDYFMFDRCRPGTLLHTAGMPPTHIIIVLYGE
eukprot:gene23042-27887_t